MNDLTLVLTAVLDFAAGAAGRFADVSVKVTALLLIAALAAAGLRSASASLRHLTWSLALAATLAVPVLGVLLPRWSVPVLPAAPDVAAPASWAPAIADVPALPFSPVAFELRAEPAPAESVLAPLLQRPWFAACAWLLAMWLSGVVLVLLKLAWEHGQMFALVQRAKPIEGERKQLADAAACKLGLRRPVPLYESAEVAVPMIWGFGEPVVLLPEQSKQWSCSRLELVLLHELAHIERGDTLTQLMAQVACALYWFHPMVWFAARRMRQLREYACDDSVLSQGARPSDYATELLELVQAIERQRVSPATVGMAQKSQLYQRVKAILDPTLPRQSFVHGRALVVAAALALLLPLAVLAPTASDAASIPPIMTAALVPPVPELIVLPEAYALPPVVSPVAGVIAGQHLHAADCTEASENAPDLDTEAARQAYVAGTAKLADEGARAEALRQLLFRAPISEQTGSAVLAATAAMKQPEAIAKVLEAFNRIRETHLVRGPLASQYLDVAQRLPPGALATALQQQLHPHEVAAAISLRALKLLERVPSADQRLAVLQEVTDHQRIDAQIEAAVAAAIAGLPEGERAETLEELADAKRSHPERLELALTMKVPDAKALAHQLAGLKAQELALRAQEKALRRQAEALEKAADKLREDLERQADEAEEQADQAAERAEEEAGEN